jgi:hypothetical protein
MMPTPSEILEEIQEWYKLMRDIHFVKEMKEKSYEVTPVLHL